MTIGQNRWRLDPWASSPLLDRDARGRLDPDRVRAAWKDPAARVIDVSVSGDVDAQQPFVATHGDFDPARASYLGLLDDAPVFARSCPAVANPASLRDAAWDAGITEAVAAAEAITAWHRAARHCESCGGKLEPDIGGFSRHCTSCGRTTFPRTDPAMIVAVLDSDDRLLLAHQTRWTLGRVSILAGFVEAGESAEHAVCREVAEETSLSLTHLRLLGTQPWPLPRSLMLAFVARCPGGAPRADGVELEWARWFTRSEVSDRLGLGTLTLPGVGSVASRIIADWRSEALPAPEG